MKILQVVPFFTPARGGSVVVPYNLSKHLAERGHEVTIITTDFELDNEYIRSLDGVRVVPFHCIANVGLMLISPKMKGWLKKEIRDFDIVHMHNFRNYQNIVAHHYAKKYDIPYVLQAHGSVLPFFQKQRLKKIFDIFFGYRILKDASKVLAYQQIEATQYQDMGVNRDKIEILTSGIDLLKTEDMPKKGEFKKKYSIKDNEKIILFLGRIHKIKGVDILVEAFADLTKNLEGARLVIAGPDGGYLSNVNNLVESLGLESKILIPGFISANDKIAAYVDADVYVLPSMYDIFPTTVLEAYSFGTPVITTDQTGIRDLVNDNAGYVVPFDKNQLSNALLKILTDDGLRCSFGKRGEKLVRERYSWETVIKQLEKIYSSIK
jgi:glycosyltransferase involved in cell wall biosynthesis